MDVLSRVFSQKEVQLNLRHMSGIRELFALMYWVNNDKKAILETSFHPDRPVSKLQKAVESSLLNNDSPKQKNNSNGIKNKHNS